MVQWSGSGWLDIYFNRGLPLSLQHNINCPFSVSYAPSQYGKCSNLMFDAFSSELVPRPFLLSGIGAPFPQKQMEHPFRFSDFLLPASPSHRGKFCPAFARQIAAGQWTSSPWCVVSGECGRVTSLMMMMQVLPPVGAAPALACPLSESVHPAKVLNALSDDASKVA